MTFSRVARLLAVLVVAAALWRARPLAAPARVAVLALPGASAEALSGIPILAGGMVEVAVPTTGAAFWKRLLTIEDDLGREPESLPPLWQGAPSAIRVSGVPLRLFKDGSDAAASAFAGCNCSTVVEYADLTSGRLPSPYDRAIEAVTAAAVTLGKDHWSDWIRVTPAPSAAGAATPPDAEFQVARVADAYYLFSPAYVVGKADVSADPFLRGGDLDQRPLLAAHVIDRSQRRAPSVTALFAGEGENRPVVVFDDVAEDVASLFASDTVPASLERAVDESLSSVLRDVRTAVGPDGVVVVVGGPSTARPMAPAWYRVMVAGQGLTGVQDWNSVDLDLVSARALLRHFVGVQLDVTEKSYVPAAIVARFPVKATIPRSSSLSKRGALSLPWSAANLESLPGAVVSGN